MFRNILNLFTSVRTTVWLILASIAFLFAGSLIMPIRPERYQGMNSELLFRWLADEWRHPIHVWFLVVLFLLVLLTVNTLVCSVESVLRRLNRREFLLRISPQLMHVGFLFILLAHLASAGWGFKTEGVLARGGSGILPTGEAIFLKNLDMERYPSGMPRTWWADVEVHREGRRIETGRIGPNQPLFYDGVGIYLKNLTMTQRGPGAQLQVARDPGALWALSGALLFTVGNVIFLGLRIRGGN